MTTCAPSRQADFWRTLGVSPESSLEARPARTSAAPTQKAKASKGKGRASTSKPSASSENAALVGSLLKTALISELGALTPSSLRWRPLTTPVGRSWFVLKTSEPITSGPDAGSSGAISGKLHTPTAMANMHNPSMEKWPSCQGWAEIAAGARLATPRASDMKAGGHGDTGRMGTVRHQLQKATLATPRKTDADRGFRGDVLSQLHGHNSKHAGMQPVPRETLPTPTKRDKRMDAWSPAYDKRKSPTMDAVIDGAMTNRALDKWQYARQIAAILRQANLSGASQTLPVVYGWMMGFPPGWLELALLSAVQEGHLPPVSSSKRMAMPSSRKSPKL